MRTFESKLVSIITPCYNGEKHVQRFLDSILAQTYNKIELIFVNDGSIDRTEEIVLRYAEKLRNAGINLVYICQDNLGLGGAINTGLKNVKGVYICWADADDFLEPYSVELRVKFLMNNPEFAIVASDAYFRSEELEIIGRVSDGYKASNEPEQFMHLIKGRSFICSGCFMVRSKQFFETHPSGLIYPSRRGQNYQMLMPLYYSHKRYFLENPLYNYVRHNCSLSGIEGNGYTEKVNTYINQKEIMLKTLAEIQMTDKERKIYTEIIQERFSSLLFRLAYIHGDYELVRNEYSEMKCRKQLSMKILVRFCLATFKKYFGIHLF